MLVRHVPYQPVMHPTMRHHPVIIRPTMLPQAMLHRHIIIRIITRLHAQQAHVAIPTNAQIVTAEITSLMIKSVFRRL